MSGTVFTKFFWSDWETDPALRCCSLGAQGLWMRMLCIAAAHDPIGYVAVAGRALSEDQLARMTGNEANEVRALLGELDRNGVFSRDRLQRIYSRRMVREAKRSAVARLNGEKGGNPSLSKQKVSGDPDNPHKPRASSQKLIKKDSKMGAKAPSLPGLEFPTWWPTKQWQGFVESRKKMGRPLSDRAVEIAIGKLTELKIKGEDPGEILDRSTFNSWRGIFGRDDKMPGPPPPTSPADDLQAWGLRLEWFHFGRPADNFDNGVPVGHWEASKWGPKPGMDGCRVPADAERDFARKHPVRAVQ